MAMSEKKGQPPKKRKGIEQLI